MRKNAKQYVKMAACGLIVVSFALCLLVVIADVGMWNTPYEAADRAGRKMGFNDPLSLEHYGILLSNFRVRKLLTPAYAYTWLLLSMHAVGGWLVWHVERFGLPRVRWFFGLQGLLFPIGWLGFLLLPSTVWSIVQGTFDREGIIDVPFIALTAQPLWIATATVILAGSWIGATRATLSDQTCEPETA